MKAYPSTLNTTSLIHKVLKVHHQVTTQLFIEPSLHPYHLPHKLANTTLYNLRTITITVVLKTPPTLPYPTLP